MQKSGFLMMWILSNDLRVRSTEMGDDKPRNCSSYLLLLDAIILLPFDIFYGQSGPGQ